MSLMPPNTGGGWGAFMDKANGLLNNPMFGMGVGLLQGAMPGGTLAGGLQAGLLGAQQIQNQNQMRAVRDLQQKQMKMQIDEMQRKRDIADKMRAAGPAWLGQPEQQGPTEPYMMPEEQMFPGEQPIGGLLSQTGPDTPATGMYAQNPEMAGLLAQQYEYDPVGTNQMMAQTVMKQQADAAAAETKFNYDSLLQYQKDAAQANKPLVVGKGGSVWVPNQGFTAPSGQITQPELADVLALKKQAQPRMDSFRKIAQSGENIKANIVRSGAFSDVNTLVAAIKVLDPESVVREGEVKLPIETSGIWNELQSKLKQAKGQGFLTDVQKKDIAGSINALLRTYERAYADIRDEYVPLAQDYQIDLQRVIGNPIQFPTLDENAMFPGPVAADGAPVDPAVKAGMDKYGAM